MNKKERIKILVDYLNDMTDKYEKGIPEITDEQWDQFLGELVGAIVVRAVGHNGGHTKGVMESTNKVVRTCFSCTVRAMRLVLQILREELLTVSQMVLATTGLCSERWFNAFRMRHLQCTINLICTDVIEPLSLIFLWQTLPICLSSLKEA